MSNYNYNTKTGPYRAKFKQMREETDTWRPHWKDLVDFISPRHGRYLSNETEESNKGENKHQKIINGIASYALGNLAAGMHGGMTSPSRPWFVLGLPDRELMEYGPVKEWLREVRDGMLRVFAKSNFYGSAHSMYRELGLVGTSAMLIEQDFKTVIRCRPFTVGEYYVALDPKHRPDTLYRQFSMTARQLVSEFGYSNCSENVQQSYDNNNTLERYEVIHCIQPNKDVIPIRKDGPNKIFSSTYFEKDGSDPDKFLRQSGYNSQPFVAPRWDVTGVDVYGNAPAMNALGDIKMLQLMEEKKLKGLDKEIDPPMNAPTSMKGKGGTIIAGGVNYIDTTQGQQAFSPAYQVKLNFNDIGQEMFRVEQRIEKFFFNNLFLAIIDAGKSNMTATEVAQRQEEKLQMLGPVIERIEAEFLDPIIDRVYNIMLDMGIIPPPPREIEDMDFKVEYISLLAQAQKIVGITSIEQTAGFIGNMSAVQPDVIDKFDFDQAVDEYADMVGVPPNLIRSDEDVEIIRQQRAAAAQQQQQIEQTEIAANQAKVLSETDVGDNNALEVLVGAGT